MIYSTFLSLALIMPLYYCDFSYKALMPMRGSGSIVTLPGLSFVTAMHFSKRK